MALADEVRREVREIFDTSWSVRDGYKVPEPEEVRLGNDAIKLRGAVLYADIAESTAMVKGFQPWFAADVYKAYLLGACRVIRANNGAITAFDGDRVMAVFVGSGKEAAAARTALQINSLVSDVVNPEIARRNYSTPYVLQHAVGIDTSELFIARTGIRGANDLVWVGRAANYAAKLCALRSGNFSTWITLDVYQALDSQTTVGGQYGTNMWEARTWAEQGVMVYASSWKWSV